MYIKILVLVVPANALIQIFNVVKVGKENKLKNKNNEPKSVSHDTVTHSLNVYSKFPDYSLHRS